MKLKIYLVHELLTGLPLVPLLFLGALGGGSRHLGGLGLLLNLRRLFDLNK